jgi:hypothetical protein
MTDAFKAKICNFLKLSGIGMYAKVLSEGLIGEFRGQFPLDEEVPASFAKAIESLKIAVDTRKPILVDAMVECYAKAYEESEIDEMIAFFESKTGQKVSSLGGFALNSMAEAGNQWSAETVNSIKDDLALILDENTDEEKVEAATTILDGSRPPVASQQIELPIATSAE